jgi:hypothetical protein
VRKPKAAARCIWVQRELPVETLFEVLRLAGFILPFWLIVNEGISQLDDIIDGLIWGHAREKPVLAS